MRAGSCLLPSEWTWWQRGSGPGPTRPIFFRLLTWLQACLWGSREARGALGQQGRAGCLLPFRAQDGLAGPTSGSHTQHEQCPWMDPAIVLSSQSRDRPGVSARKGPWTRAAHRRGRRDCHLGGWGPLGRRALPGSLEVVGAPPPPSPPLPRPDAPLAAGRLRAEPEGRPGQAFGQFDLVQGCGHNCHPRLDSPRPQQHPESQLGPDRALRLSFHC